MSLGSIPSSTTTLDYNKTPSQKKKTEKKRNTLKIEYLIQERNSNCLELAWVQTKLFLKATWLEPIAGYSAVFTFQFPKGIFTLSASKGGFQSYRMLIKRVFIKYIWKT